MTKKHFIKLAEILRRLKGQLEGNPFADFEVWSKAVTEIADMCEESNPNFNRLRFLAAAGYLEGKGEQ